MVRAYTDLQYPLYIGPHAPEVVAAIVSLVEAARAAGIPVVYTGVRYEPGGADGGIFFRKVHRSACLSAQLMRAVWSQNFPPGPTSR